MSYKYSDFKEWLDSEECHKHLIDQIIYIKFAFEQAKFNGSFHVTREDLIGSGDSWNNLAITDRLCELCYIELVDNSNEVSNYWTYRNRRL